MSIGTPCSFYDEEDFAGLEIEGDAAFEFVEALGHLLDDLHELRDEAHRIKCGGSTLENRMARAIAEAATLHRIAIFATGGHISIEEADEPDRPPDLSD